VGSFGAALHISGYEHDKMAEVLLPFAEQNQLQLKEILPNLEDVFIALIKIEPKEVDHG
jgi:hypothetical protein